ncbi:SH3 domain-containing protein [Actinacidiphila oryziradicis]|uniref:SH3 domain-containing protein n=1 Tax=Actinacidiphila oryziradicis TaxID=2571141 RepID=A0A4U0RMI5_9ACTN|nr:SH3 domain-containing protein [Actinacidiphila oryziradicis]TJZ96312.1 SH3 domain-containing protein [Actinacidiphila oryziradicis]
MKSHALKKALAAAVISLAVLSGTAATAAAPAHNGHRQAPAAAHCGQNLQRPARRAKATVRGHVVHGIGRLNVRSGPGTGYRVIGSLRPGNHPRLAYKVRGTTVRGNSTWYKLADRKGYVSARYVKDLDTVAWR